MHIGTTVKFIRVSKGLTQKELARFADLSPSYISLVERGERDPGFSTTIGVFESLEFNPVIAIYMNEQPDLGEEIDKIMPHAIIQELKKPITYFVYNEPET